MDVAGHEARDGIGEGCTEERAGHAKRNERATDTGNRTKARVWPGDRPGDSRRDGLEDFGRNGARLGRGMGKG